MVVLGIVPGQNLRRSIYRSKVSQLVHRHTSQAAVMDGKKTGHMEVLSLLKSCFRSSFPSQYISSDSRCCPVCVLGNHQVDERFFL